LLSSTCAICPAVGVWLEWPISMVNKDAKIDKTFLIAEPMGKVSWTKCFAGGGLRQVGVDLRGTYARMPQQDLDQTDVHALLKHVCGKAVAKRVRPELVAEAALVSRFVEGGS
jgi:hypothetical protein